jgi:four helix bundle protein
MYAAIDRKYVDENTFDDVYSTCTEISKMIMELIKYLRD